MTEEQIDAYFFGNEEIKISDYAKVIYKRGYDERCTGELKEPQYGFHFSDEEITELSFKQELCFYKAEYVKDLSDIERLKKVHAAKYVYIGWVMYNQYCPIREFDNEIRQFAAQIQLVKSKL